MTIPNIPVTLNLNIRGLLHSATLRINERCAELTKQGKKVYRFGFGQSPFPVPEPVVQALRDHAHEKDYLAVKGLRELREAIAGFHNRHAGTRATADDVLVGPGSKELMFLLQIAYYGDLVIPRPSWVSYAPQARIASRHVYWLPTREERRWLLQAEGLEAFCAKDPTRPRLLILNYPANPTGATYTAEELMKLAEVARKYQVVVLSDEIYGEINHEGKHVSIASFYPEGTIISSGLSKWCGAGGWRLGTFTFPPSMRWLLDGMVVVASETFTSTSAPIQYAAVRAFQPDAGIDQYLRHSRKILQAVATEVSSQLNAHHIKHPQPEGGFYLFPNFEYHRASLEARGIYTSEAMCDALLQETGVALLPASDFGFPEEFFAARLSYVDFDGARALRMAESAISPTADEIAPHVMEGIQQLVNWF